MNPIPQKLTEARGLIELKPCPFCGVSDCLTIPSHAALKWVQCNNIHCQAEGPVAETPELAIEAWNTRASQGANQ